MVPLRPLRCAYALFFRVHAMEFRLSFQEVDLTRLDAVFRKIDLRLCR